jgi:phosphatidylserine/phosphatidylglycerophosphate/cardiolipin synthase-like enzyme
VGLEDHERTPTPFGSVARYLSHVRYQKVRRTSWSMFGPYLFLTKLLGEFIRRTVNRLNTLSEIENVLKLRGESMRNGLFGLAAAIGFMGCASIPQAAHASVDVVQSVPLETNLALPNVQDTQSAWIELINTAQHTIDMEEFYISVGDSLQPVLSALKAASARGVHIRLLLDKGFYTSSPTDGNNFALIPNTEVKTVDFSSYGGIMHAKYFVIDNQRAYVGSANFDWLALSHIHEVGLKVDDASISTGLETIFSQDWAMSTIHSKKGGKGFVGAVTGADLLQIFASPTTDVPAGISPTLAELVKLMGSATKSVKIQMYEYDTKVRTTGATTATKFTTLDDAIRAAAARGVKVQLIVDKTALKAGSADLKALALLPNIEIRVITIPQWSGGPLQYARLIHSKYMIIDDQTAWIGSENWEASYFTGTRNVGLVTNDAGGLAKLVQIHATVWNCGYSSAP